MPCFPWLVAMNRYAIRLQVRTAARAELRELTIRLAGHSERGEWNAEIAELQDRWLTLKQSDPQTMALTRPENMTVAMWEAAWPDPLRPKESYEQ